MKIEFTQKELELIETAINFALNEEEFYYSEDRIPAQNLLNILEKKHETL